MKKVLVIDSDTVAARRMGTLWEASGYLVRVVTDLSRAALVACQWTPHLITLDFEGSEEEGREVILQLQSRPQTCRTPIVLFSNKARTAIPGPLLRSVHTVVEKSVSFDRLLTTLPATRSTDPVGVGGEK